MKWIIAVVVIVVVGVGYVLWDLWANYRSEMGHKKDR